MVMVTVLVTVKVANSPHPLGLIVTLGDNSSPSFL